MKIFQTLTTKIVVKLSEIPNLPTGFKVKEVRVSNYNIDRRDGAESIELDGEIEVHGDNESKTRLL